MFSKQTFVLLHFSHVKMSSTDMNKETEIKKNRQLTFIKFAIKGTESERGKIYYLYDGISTIGNSEHDTVQILQLQKECIACIKVEENKVWIKSEDPFVHVNDVSLTDNNWSKLNNQDQINIGCITATITFQTSLQIYADKMQKDSKNKPQLSVEGISYACSSDSKEYELDLSPTQAVTYGLNSIQEVFEIDLATTQAFTYVSKSVQEGSEIDLPPTQAVTYGPNSIQEDNDIDLAPIQAVTSVKNSVQEDSEIDLAPTQAFTYVSNSVQEDSEIDLPPTQAVTYGSNSIQEDSEIDLSPTQAVTSVKNSVLEDSEKDLAPTQAVTSVKNSVHEDSEIDLAPTQPFTYVSNSVQEDSEIDLPPTQIVTYFSNSVQEDSEMDLPPTQMVSYVSTSDQENSDKDLPVAEAVSCTSNSSEDSDMDLHFATFPVKTDVDMSKHLLNDSLSDIEDDSEILPESQSLLDSIPEDEIVVPDTEDNSQSSTQVYANDSVPETEEFSKPATLLEYDMAFFPDTDISKQLVEQFEAERAILPGTEDVPKSALQEFETVPDTEEFSKSPLQEYKTGIVEDTEVILDDVSNSVTDIAEIRILTHTKVVSDDVSYSVTDGAKIGIVTHTEVILEDDSKSETDVAKTDTSGVIIPSVDNGHKYNRNDSHVQNINQDNPNDVSTPTSSNHVHRKRKLCTELGISSKKIEKTKKFGLKNTNDITKLASANKAVRKQKVDAECSINIKEDQNKNQNYTNDAGIKTSNEAVQKTDVYPECSTSSKRMKNHPRISSFKNTNGAKSTLSDRTLRKRNASANCSVMGNRITKQVKSDSNTNNVMPTSSKAAVRKINTRTDCTVMSKKEEKQPVQSDTKNNLVSTSSIQAARKRKLSAECTTSKKLKIPGKSGFKNTNDVQKPTTSNQAIIKQKVNTKCNLLSKRMQNRAGNSNLKSGVRSDKMNTNTSYSLRKNTKAGNSCLYCENSVKSKHTKHSHATATKVSKRTSTGFKSKDKYSVAVEFNTGNVSSERRSERIQINKNLKTVDVSPKHQNIKRKKQEKQPISNRGLHSRKTFSANMCSKSTSAMQENPVVMINRLDSSTIENLKSKCTNHSNRIEKENKRYQDIKIMFTGDNFDAEHKIAESLGAEIVDNVENCSHLVAKEVKRTIKFLCCIGSGIPILSTQWLLESQKVGGFVDYNPFILKDKKSEAYHKFKLEKTLRQAKEKPLFTGYNFYISGVVKPSNEDLKGIIKCSGGTILNNLPSGRIENVVIIADEDVLKNDPFMRSKVQRSIVLHKSKLESSEFVLAGLLQYKVNFKKYRITC